MQATIEQEQVDTDRYARAVAASKRVRWSIEEDVIRNRTFDTRHKFLPDGLSKVKEFAFLSDGEQRYLSQIQGRTYANIFGLVERYINAKVLEISRDHWFGDQTALEALVRFSDEELKHQELFRRIEKLVAETMPAGYRFQAATGRGSRGCAREEHVGRAGIDVGHRAFHADALPAEHRTGREPFAALQGCVPLPLERGIPTRHSR